MEDYIKFIFPTFISVTAIGGFTYWLVKELLKKFLQADTERYKNRLQLEHQKFTKLQNEQFETIKIIYANLIRTDEFLNEAFQILKKGGKFGKKNMDRILIPLGEIIFETDRHFKKNSIFLNEELCSKIEKCIKALFFCLTKSSYAMIVRSEDVFDQNRKFLGIGEQEMKDLSEADKKVFEETIMKIEKVRNSELKESITTLKKEFRILFGVK